MRFSQQRETIRKIVCETCSHPTADWIFHRAKKAIPNISLGTVYRNLGQLVEHDIIKAYHIGGVVRYDGNTSVHHHFICDQCGTIQDIVTDDKDLISKLENGTKNKISSYQMKIRGSCTACLKRKKLK